MLYQLILVTLAQLDNTMANLAVLMSKLHVSLLSVFSSSFFYLLVLVLESVFKVSVPCSSHFPTLKILLSFSVPLLYLSLLLHSFLFHVLFSSLMYFCIPVLPLQRLFLCLKMTESIRAQHQPYFRKKRKRETS